MPKIDRYLALSVLCSVCATGDALAQKTDQNATTQSTDAFGRSVGNERNGLYGNSQVRGFNPVDAGNVRLGGLYIDLMDRVPQRISDENTVRLGIAAQGYPFPAPTGLVDYALSIVGDNARASLDLSNSSNMSRGFGGTLEFDLPLIGNQLELNAGFGGRQAVRAEGGEHKARSYGATLTFRPVKNSEISIFSGGNFTRGEEARSTLFMAGNNLPPELPRGKFLGQSWTERNYDIYLHGLLIRYPLGGFRLEAGLFDSISGYASNYSDLLTGVKTDGSSTNRIIVASAGTKDESISGEARIIRAWLNGSLAHRMILSMRGRNKDRIFGGSRRISLGPSSAIALDFRNKPDFELGEHDIDTVRQRTLGFAYNLRWQGRGTLDFGISKSHYQKEVNFANPAAIDPVARDNPVLANMAASIQLNSQAIAFGGYTQGQEEALIAPDIAINRAESPPAVRTRQMEMGLRYALTQRLSFVAGMFKITKPYYNLDPSLRYRQLGALSNSGVELSLAGQIAPGLSVVSGTLFLDPRISGEAVEGGLIGKRPVGQFTRRSILNLDWRLKNGHSPFSVDIAFESLSSRMANTANSLKAPPRTNLNLGMRYRFNVGDDKFLIRAQVQNALNQYGWDVNSSGGFTYTNDRALSLQLVADF